MRVARWAWLGLLVGCEAATPPEVLVDWWPEEITLEPAAWNDSDFEWANVGVINQGYFTLTVDGVTLGGDGASNLELGGATDGIELGLRETATIPVRFRPPVNNDRTLWSTQTFTAVTLSFTVSGYGVVDASTGAPDVSVLSSRTISVPLTFSTLCDLDGDGYDVNVCSGLDCNDDMIAINPAAVEVCDGADNNCAGGIDEGCP